MERTPSRCDSVGMAADARPRRLTSRAVLIFLLTVVGFGALAASDAADDRTSTAAPTTSADPVPATPIPPPVGSEPGDVTEPEALPQTEFDGSDGVLRRLREAAPAVLAEHVTGRALRPAVDWQVVDGRREVTGAYTVGGLRSDLIGPRVPGISLSVRHEDTAPTADDTRPWLARLTPSQFRETTLPDGSRLRVYEGYDVGSGVRYLNVLVAVHVRTDGVVVSALCDTIGRPRPAFPFAEDDLAAVATDARLTF